MLTDTDRSRLAAKAVGRIEGHKAEAQTLGKQAMSLVHRARALSRALRHEVDAVSPTGEFHDLGNVASSPQRSRRRCGGVAVAGSDAWSVHEHQIHERHQVMPTRQASRDVLVHGRRRQRCCCRRHA